MTVRPYKMLEDFMRVSKFLTDSYTKEEMNGYLMQPFFEYAHTHSAFIAKLSHRVRLWEENGEIVGIACYEMDLWDCFVCVKKGYETLYEDMLEYVENEMSVNERQEKITNIWIVDSQSYLRRLLVEKGFELSYTDSITLFNYKNDFIERKLPDGFRIVSLMEENNPLKINHCLWKGFNHEGIPDNDIEGILFMQSGPHFRKDLGTIIIDPDGEYACYAGMWIDSKNKYAYLEPIATIPKWRNMGLGTIALTHSMKKTKEAGAEYCFGGSSKFYTTIGFETVGNREKWVKIAR